VDTKLDQRALDAALRLFVASFVVDDKRKQIHQRLLTAERRAETLATLPRWLAGRQAPLEGADKSPAGIRKRFGELVGVRIVATGAVRVTIEHALVREPSVFIADNGNFALVTPADGAPILLSRL
jgi:hypothetical protein